jgi:inhibitor of KinA sporulation pathway (predicted exonuclease)
MRQEIIEIGLVEMDLHTLEITRESAHFVRPKRWEISDRCTKMTGITKDDIQNARPFPAVIEALKEEFVPSKAQCCAWGHDADLVASTCQAHGFKTPLRYQVDMSRLFQELFLLKQTPGLRDAVEMLGLDFDGVPHGALVDARNTARVHAAVIRRMRQQLEPPSIEQTVEANLVTSFGEKLRRAISKENPSDFPKI